MSLLAGEDSVSGLVDAALMQFYPATEAVLGRHDKGEALQAGAQLFGAEFDQNLRLIVCHAYLARPPEALIGQARNDAVRWTSVVGCVFCGC